VVLLNNPNAIDKFAVFHFVICALSFLGNLFIDIPELRIQLSPEMTKILWYYNMFFSAIVTALLSILLTRFISTQNKEIYQQNIDLLQTKEAIDLSLKEKEVLLAELHHRVKNNLAIITGLVNLQGEATDSEEAKQVLSDTKSRIMSMALVHRMLYENADLKSIDIGKYSMELLTELFNGYNLHKKVSINCTFDPIMLPVSKSVPLGLILNEVVTNSIKYAYKAHPQQNGVFSIDIKLNGNRVVLTISDNGPGFPKDFNKETDGQSLGIYLIKTLVEQIDGSIEFSNNNGAQIRLNFNTN
jgi:two-component sensor histidine kinase